MSSWRKSIYLLITTILFLPSIFIGAEGGDWITRLRGLYLLPSDHSDAVSSIPGSGVKARPAWTAEIDCVYMFTSYLGAELIASTAYTKVMGTKSIDGLKVGSTWILPPTLTLNAHFFPHNSFQPYIGGGLNFTVFYAKHCYLENTTLHISPSWGPAVQAGTDWYFTENYCVNFDVKYIWIWTQAHLKGAVSGTVNMDINPWVFGVGIGRKW